MRIHMILGATMAAVLAPSIATAQTTTQTAPAAPQTPAAAEGCLRDLQVFNRELIETGFGVPGPRGYGTAGLGIAGADTAPAGTAGAGTVGAFGTFGAFGAGTAVATPRGEMRAVLTAAQVFALHGDQETCQTILEGARDLHRERIAQFEALGVPLDEVTTWRAQRLTSAVPVTEVGGRAQIGDLLGADVRNPVGEDLGDVEDIVLGPEGEVRYVLVSRGGFLGLGGELVPVRWEDLRVTPEPFDDTLVLNVREEHFENAPAIDEDAAEAMTGGRRFEALDRYWDQTLVR